MSSHPIDIHVGKKIRLRRIVLGLSQAELGSKIGVTFQQIQKYERGANRVGSSRLYDLSQVLSVQINFFFEGLNDLPSLLGDVTISGLAEKTTSGFTNEDIDSKETVTLVKAYYKIEDPAVRKKVLGLIKAVGPA